MEPTHVHCFEDDSYTEIGDGDDAEDTPCAECEDAGRDAFTTAPVAIAVCPNGVTAADWRPGGYVEGKNCDDDSHDPRTGNHVVDLDR